MIRDAIDRILELSAPHTVQAGDITYADRKMFQIGECKPVKPITVHTLSSMIDYIREMERFDSLRIEDFILHVKSHRQVELFSSLNIDRERDVIVIAEAETPVLTLERFIDNEHMIIMMQSMFVDDPDTDRAAVMRFAGTVKAGTVKEYGDDGVSQKATIKMGVATLGDGLVPSPCVLKPYRTFMEVDQPQSRFIFRMKESGDSVLSALYEADGGAWKLGAMQNIAEYLTAELKETGIPVIW